MAKITVKSVPTQEPELEAREQFVIGKRPVSGNPEFVEIKKDLGDGNGEKEFISNSILIEAFDTDLQVRFQFNGKEISGDFITVGAGKKISLEKAPVVAFEVNPNAADFQVLATLV